MSDNNTPNLDTAAAWLLRDETLQDDALWMDLEGCRLQLRSNSQALLDQLKVYFAHVLSAPGDADLALIAIEGPEPELPVTFIDWRREPGKTGRKDSYVDLPGARLVRKVRTGMVFLQSETLRIAAGPCLRYDNQVINFINAQYMNWLQNRGWVICHAAGLVHAGSCLGMAGLSGGGKSTLMLQLMDNDEIGFLTNDRLFVHRDDQGVDALGIPKLPRINPGTIVHNPRLQPLIPAERREQLLALPQQELWELEEKHDVMVEDVYGKGRITPHARLKNFLVLNWQRHSDEPLKVQQVELEQRDDILGAIMKSPGPFYQFPDGRFLADDDPLDANASLSALKGVPIWEVSGGVDFEALRQYCSEKLL